MTFGAALYQLVGFDVKLETLSTLIWQRLYWQDQFIQWDPADYEVQEGN